MCHITLFVLSDIHILINPVFSARSFKVSSLAIRFLILTLNKIIPVYFDAHEKRVILFMALKFIFQTEVSYF